ncbi:MAG: hypothetical protein PHH13_03020 [Candidatus Peribacteraceae bacterium]|nr:hypothetical protein [Candidatus Peribacteraceae bacterium]
MTVEASSSAETDGQAGLALADLPVYSKFAGGGNVYLKIAPGTAVQIRFDRGGGVVGYGSSIPLDQFPDVRFSPMDQQQGLALQAEQRLPTVGQELASSVRRCRGSILHCLSHRLSNTD